MHSPLAMCFSFLYASLCVPLCVCLRLHASFCVPLMYASARAVSSLCLCANNAPSALCFPNSTCQIGGAGVENHVNSAIFRVEAHFFALPMRPISPKMRNFAPENNR